MASSIPVGAAARTAAAGPSFNVPSHDSDERDQQGHGDQAGYSAVENGRRCEVGVGFEFVREERGVHGSGKGGTSTVSKVP